ncbi:hypothetical protein CLOSBL3_12809 [Clostridiaceae bacterium BL-3]|nr:hypothetical protein CLOSBL3_12809 [Clostridiaceae bacterium BL-3]
MYNNVEKINFLEQLMFILNSLRIYYKLLLAYGQQFTIFPC